jgi:two-component system, OmpR family, sensor histidine kinase MtrB
MGLRARITLTFTLGSFLLSVLLSGTTYALTRGTLVRQREDAALERAYDNAERVQDYLRGSVINVREFLQSLPLRSGSTPVVERRGTEWESLEIQFGENALPDGLKDRAGGGVAARMTYEFEGEVYHAIGVPLTGVEARYYEIVAFDDLDSTLRSVGLSLLGAALITTSFGTVVGMWAARRAVRPLADAAQAAEAIAGGQMGTRLEAHDDKDLQLLADSFNRMAGALQDRVERDARFASDVSHELRSPLMTLSASIEVLQSRREEMPERAQQALDLLVADVSRFRQLVEDLLEISRFDAGSVRLTLDEVEVAEFVRQAARVAGYADVAVEVDPAAAASVIRADKRRLARVVQNLLDNARNHGTGATGIRVEPAAGGDRPECVWIEVEDRGPGVPVEERAQIFERFNRGGAAGRRGTGDGVGLGLALVEEHVKLHRGRVWVDDRADAEEGARFIIELPVVRW